MNLEAFRDQVTEDLKALAPANVKIVSHPGRFDLEELDRYGADAPCVRVAVLKSADSGMEGAPIDQVSVSAYLVTKQAGDKPADDVNLALATFLKVRLWSAQIRVGGADAGRPKQLTYQNLYSTAVGRAGVCLGALTWEQSLELPTFNLSDPVPFLRAFTTYGFVPPQPDTPQAADHQTLPGPLS